MSQEYYDRTAYSILSNAGYTPEMLYGNTVVRPTVESSTPQSEEVRAGSEWGVEESKYGENTLFVIQRGKMVLDMEVSPERSRMTWEAVVPKQFQPHQSHDTYASIFIPHILHWLPDMIYGTDTRFVDTAARYHDGSTFSLNIDGEVRAYQLRFRSQEVRFEVDLIRPLGRIRALGVHAEASDDPHNEYDMAVFYGDGLDDSGVISLEISNKGLTNHLWNQATLAWVIGTHKSLPLDAKRPELAADLHTVIMPRLQQVTSRLREER